MKQVKSKLFLFGCVYAFSQLSLAVVGGCALQRGASGGGFRFTGTRSCAGQRVRPFMTFQVKNSLALPCERERNYD